MNLTRVIEAAIADVARQFGLSHAEAVSAFHEHCEDDQMRRMSEALARQFAEED